MLAWAVMAIEDASGRTKSSLTWRTHRCGADAADGEAAPLVACSPSTHLPALPAHVLVQLPLAGASSQSQRGEQHLAAAMLDLAVQGRHADGERLRDLLEQLDRSADSICLCSVLVVSGWC